MYIYTCNEYKLSVITSGVLKFNIFFIKNTQQKVFFTLIMNGTEKLSVH